MAGHTKFQIAIIAVIILIIPAIIVFQLTKADIVINIENDFENQCFFGQTKCNYIDSSRNVGAIIFSETVEQWQILGENVWCIKTDREVAEPVSDPVGVITDEDEVTCNNIAIFDRNEWDLQVGVGSNGSAFTEYIFTMKGL